MLNIMDVEMTTDEPVVYDLDDKLNVVKKIKLKERIIVENIQDEEIFVKNLSYHRSDWKELINKSKFSFQSTGNFSYYYDHDKSRTWGKIGLIVVVQSDKGILDKWQNIQRKSQKELEFEFMNALTPNDEYEVVDERFNILERSSPFNMTDQLQDNINRIATRDDLFIKRPVDEKLVLLNDTIENLLKRPNGFIQIDDNRFFGLLKNDDIKKFRKLTHVFRHGSEESIKKRERLGNNEKEFLVNYGTMIVVTLSNNGFK